jgi:tetratricopeptide (TPR) repeat protein
MIALFTALLFLCHPLQTESVLYIMSRGGILAATFFLGGFLVWQNFLHSPIKDRSYFGKWISFSAILILFVIGFSAKQNVATLPVMLGLYYLAGCPPGSAPLRFLSRWKWAILLVLGLGFLILMRKLLSDESFLIGPTDPGELLSRKIYMLTQPVVIVFYYFKLFLFPVNLNIDPDIQLIRTFLDARFLSAILMIMALGIASIYAKSSRVFLFCCAWFFIVLSPSSSIVTLQDLAAEHRVYLASIGVFLLLAIGLVLAARNMGKIILPLSVLILFSVMTTHRNNDWRSEQALWTDAMAKSPQLTRPVINLARAASLAGKVDQAESYYRQALEKRPDVFVTHYNLAELILKQDKQEEAIALLEKAKNLKPKIPETYGKLGEVYLQREQYLLAEKNFRKAVELNPKYATALRNLGVVNYYHLGRKKDGLLYFARSLTLDPKQAQADELRKLLQKSP